MKFVTIFKFDPTRATPPDELAGRSKKTASASYAEKGPAWPAGR